MLICPLDFRSGMLTTTRLHTDMKFSLENGVFMKIVFIILLGYALGKEAILNLSGYLP